MDFSTQNSARKIVQDKPHWKSRPLDLGNRHRTTLNFGDLVPAYWQHVEPGDKLKMDATILAKFMPLLAPAFSRMKIKSEWFYVPLKQISPSSLRALQDFKPDDAVSAFNELLQTGLLPVTLGEKCDDQQVSFGRGFPSLPAWYFSKFFASSTSSIFKTNGPSAVWSSGDIAFNGSSLSLTHWRTQSTINSSDPVFLSENLGLEDFVCFASLNRCRKMLNYLGLPKRLTTLRYTKDVVVCQSADESVKDSYDNKTFLDGSSMTHDSYYDTSSEQPYISDYYRQLVFGEMNFHIPSDGVVGISPQLYADSYWLHYFTVPGGEASSTVTFDSTWRGFDYPVLTTGSSAFVSLLPMQCYQKIFNDFYRDEKLQPEEVRYFPYAVWKTGGLYDGFSSNVTTRLCTCDARDVQNNVALRSPSQSNFVRVMNNLCMLRRRNRAKDVLSSCVTDKVLVNRLAGSSTAPNVFQSNLFSKIEKYLMKKEFTGSTWAEWLSNFFGENSNDYLNNNVIFLGAKESVVSISENIQTSEGNENSPQGNRAGLAGDFHSGDSIYFRVPDFGIVMCIVSVIPDELDNFNGLQERFERYSPYQFNLPDLQNIGFSPIFNRRANISWFDNNTAIPPNNQVTEFEMYDGSKVFGYQPFGYQHTYTPNLITGDFQTSLRYWHQSPDLDYDFTNWALAENASSVNLVESWKNGQLSLNSNLPAIGLRQQPLGSDLSAQYYNNVFASLNDESGDHIVADMRFFVNCHRKTAFFTDAIGDD